MRVLLFSLSLIFFTATTFAQLSSKEVFTKLDTLRGSINENRDWWDVLHYDITVQPNFDEKTIAATCAITSFINYDTLHSQCTFQLDIQDSFYIEKLFINNIGITFSREKNVIICSFRKEGILRNGENIFKVIYNGKPRIANNPPWDGGWIWKKDKLDRPFVSVACQGLGASSWYPCKDHQIDKPDNGATITIIVPDSLVAIGNGLLKAKVKSEQQKNTLQNQKLATFTWRVNNPINSYNIIPYIGNYVNFRDTFMGLKGKLDLSFWVIDYNKEKAIEQFAQVKLMLRAFEHWFGAYPFYEDGYKLVESPHLGMEHQSAIAYGNKFGNGYLGRDLSGTGWGLKWDFIIVHESGHEWFANNITTKDIADMWVHEGFTCYSETLFTEYYYGRDAANQYCNGIKKNIQNDKPIIGPYGVNKEGSGDMYYKAANMIHSIRYAMNNEEKFRQMLIEMNKVFYHKTVTSKDVESFINNFSGIDFSGVFNQYLRATTIPTLEYYFKRRKFFYKYSNCVDEFNLPIFLSDSNIKMMPTIEWSFTKLKRKQKKLFSKNEIEKLYLLNVIEVKNEAQ